MASVMHSEMIKILSKYSFRKNSKGYKLIQELLKIDDTYLLEAVVVPSLLESEIPTSGYDQILQVTIPAEVSVVFDGLGRKITIKGSCDKFSYNIPLNKNTEVIGDK